MRPGEPAGACEGRKTGRRAASWLQASGVSCDETFRQPDEFATLRSHGGCSLRERQRTRKLPLWGDPTALKKYDGVFLLGGKPPEKFGGFSPDGPPQPAAS
jgi:hypothetical protein